MRRVSFRNLLAHKVRFLMTAFAVVLGVGFVVGSFVVTDSLRRSVDQLFTDVTSGVDVSVRATTSLSRATTGGPGSRGRVPEDLVDVVRRVEGVAAAEGMVTGYAQLLDRRGKPLTTTGAPFLGVSWGEADALYPTTLDQGRKPRGNHEVAIDRGTAGDYGFAVGQRTQVLLADGSRPEVEIVGIFRVGEANNLLGARLTAFDGAVAQDLLGAAGMFDSIDVVAGHQVDPARLVAAIRERLPEGVEAVTRAEVRLEASQSMDGFLDVFQNALLGFAAVALFVAAFYINNTFSIALAQRTRELALLRSLGASRRQITASVAIEAVVAGVVASALGVGFGLVIAVALRGLLGAAGIDLPDERLVLTGRSLVAAGVVGVGVTLVASLGPAWRASSVPPVAGMREGFVPARWSPARRTRIGAALTGLGALLVVIGLFTTQAAMTVAVVLGTGAVAVFIGVAQLSPVLAVPLAGRLGRPLTGPFGAVGRLAHANAVRNPDRTAKTASALMIGLALVTTVFVVGTSMKRSFARSLERAVSADFVVSTGTFVGFSPAVTAALAGLPELDAVTGVRTDQFLIEGEERTLVAVDPVAAGAVIDIDVRSGSLDDLGPGSVFVHQDSARDLEVGVGDRVTVEFASGGPQELAVAGIHGDATYAGNFVIDMATFERYYPTNQLDLYAFARVAPGVEATRATAAVESLVADHPEVTLDDRASWEERQVGQLNNLLVAVNGLLGLALVIALLGIANTLALSVLERTREIGLLRAVGMRRSQARRMVLAESVMVAIFGAVLGVAVGAVFGVAAATAMPASVITTVAVPVGTLVVIVVTAALCGTLAGLVPARRAARLEVLRAIAAD